MAHKLDDMLEPGEQVVYRLPPPRGALLRFLVAVLAVAVLILSVRIIVPFLFGDDGTIRVYTAVGVILALLPLVLAQNLSTDAAVTDRRLLVWTRTKTAAPTLVGLAEIENTEVLRGGLRVFRGEGAPVLLVRSRGLPELAAALAGAAGLQPPRGPLPREVAADRMLIRYLVVAGLLPGLACLMALENLFWAIGGGAWLLPVAVASLAAVPAFFLLGLLAGLLAIRRRFTRPEMQGWIEGSAHFAQSVAEGGLGGRLAHRFLAFALRLYGPPSTPDNTGTTSGDRLKRSQDNRSSDHGA